MQGDHTDKCVCVYCTCFGVEVLFEIAFVCMFCLCVFVYMCCHVLSITGTRSRCSLGSHGSTRWPPCSRLLPSQQPSALRRSSAGRCCRGRCQNCLRYIMYSVNSYFSVIEGAEPGLRQVQQHVNLIIASQCTSFKNNHLGLYLSSSE